MGNTNNRLTVKTSFVDFICANFNQGNAKPNALHCLEQLKIRYQGWDWEVGLSGKQLGGLTACKFYAQSGDSLTV
jgi:hypothetical protein